MKRFRLIICFLFIFYFVILDDTAKKLPNVSLSLSLSLSLSPPRHQTRLKFGQGT